MRNKSTLKSTTDEKMVAAAYYILLTLILLIAFACIGFTSWGFWLLQQMVIS